MPEFQILDEKRYPLYVRDNDDASSRTLPYYRWEHRVTLGYRSRDFMVFIDTLTTKAYIEEVTGGHLEVIADDSLHESLAMFAQNKGFLCAAQPILRPSNRS